MSEQNAETIRRLYDALDRHDGATMAACYAPDATFEDPAFGKLRGKEVGGMWRMLAGRATDLAVELREHSAEGDGGTARWIATYTFSTGRPVVNDVRSRFRFEDGLIAEQVDSFDRGAWARQALGPPLGIAITVIPPLGFLIQRRARGDLDAFLAG